MKDKINALFKLIWQKIKGLAIKLKDAFNRKFPRKDPKLFDASLHDTTLMRNMAIYAVLINLFIEVFARVTNNPFGGFIFLFKHPVIFLYNALIIFAIMTLCMLFKRRRFALTIISLIWIILGIVNGVILLKRMTPFTLYDMQNLGDGATLIKTYFAKWQVTLATMVIVVGILSLVLLFIRSVKWKNIDYKKSLVVIALSAIAALVSSFGLIKMGVLSTFFGNLNYAYNDYGFCYCFINTSVNKGIHRPADYSKESITKILEEDTSNGTDRELENVKDSKKHPNIIVLQMESFTTADSYKNVSVDKDPTPTFNKLKKEFTSGKFEVPACGAGTSNTEFEVLTGISAKFFGPGEYPYKGKLRNQTLESMGYVTKSHGYENSALHNHRALFYNRNEVYANMGFDSFTSVEYMNEIEKTPKNWCKDKVLIDEIMEIMKSSKSRDFMHVVSVEGHGKYPDEQVFKKPYTTVTADNESTKWKYEYYFNIMHEMDQFIKDLTDELEENGEPTIMIIYGDHIPALDVKEANYENGDLYQTDYVIWDNMGLKKQDQDITSYQAGAILLDLAGLDGEGVIFDYQQNTDFGSKNYNDKLKALSYDILYGNYYSFGGINPYKRTNMTLGHKKIKIKDVVKIGKKYYITGKNFTESSKISLDDELLSTTYLTPELLGLNEKVDKEDVPKLKVSQIDSKDNTILSSINSLEEL